MNGLPGSVISRLVISSIRRRSPSSRGARRRRIPRLMRAWGSAAYSRYMKSRSVSVTISSVSSSWLRRKMPHWQLAGMSGVRARMSLKRLPVLQPHRHEHPRHQREVERHVELVAVAEVGADVLGPHVRLGEQHLARGVGVEAAAAVPAPLRGSPAGSRRTCPRARRGTGPRPRGSRRRRGPARTASHARPLRGPPGCRS